MSEFDKIIGYEETKEELKQLCDMIHNMPIYEKIGAKMPKGLLLHGVPGVGKSLMARCFIKECGRKSYTIRRNKHDGDFINEIKDVFTEAAENAPSIVFLDDMDKFVVEDKGREEYVAVQACIDEVVFSDVYVVATANDLDDIPDSLLRAGRFDRKIYVKPPIGEDAKKIIQHYMMSKSVESDININDIVKMFYGKSCAELETILNESAMYAGYERCDNISMKHIVQHVLRSNYGVSETYNNTNTEELEKTAFHEAAHVVISEIYHPGNIGLASLCKRSYSDYAGFVICCSHWTETNNEVIMSLAGKAATEIKFGSPCKGSSIDLSNAVDIISDRVKEEGFCGISGLDVFPGYRGASNTLLTRQESMIQSELERYMLKTKEILIKNIEFLDAVAHELLKKETLLNSDINRIRESSGKIVA